MRFEAAVDAYLNGSDRSRPWTQQEEEQMLRGLAGWLPGQVESDTLDDITPDVLARYADERRLSDEERDDLQGTVASLRVWARRRVDDDEEQDRPATA
ncbi:MAG TPA: hypothetical protein VEY93_06870 [Longimicrobium sp.]|nr:hypothetical protein [Longimicrobium sp.]